MYEDFCDIGEFVSERWVETWCSLCIPNWIPRIL